MAFSLSTFAQTEQKMEAAEQVAPAIQEPSESAVNENGHIQIAVPDTTVTPDAVVEKEEQPTTAQEDNVSDFKIDGEEPVQEASPQPSTPAATSYNWKEEIKKLDKKEVAKELGFNDFSIEMDEYLAKGGKAVDYIDKRGIDWGRVADEDLAKQDLKNLYPDASPQQIERLYNKKYSQQGIDTEEDREDGILLMKADARRIREAKLQEQNSFKIPEAIIPQIKDEAYEQWKQQQASQPAMAEKIKEFYSTHEATKSLNESKRVAVNLGEGVVYNFSVSNPDALTKIYTDGGETWNKLTSTKLGEPDVQKQQLISLFMYDPAQYSNAIFNYGMQMGKRRLMEEGQNALKPQQKVQPQELNGQASYSTGKFGDKQRN